MILAIKQHKIDITKLLVYLSIILLSAFVVFGSVGSTVRDICLVVTVCFSVIDIGIRTKFKLRILKSSYLLFYFVFFFYCVITIIWSKNFSSAAISIRHILFALFLGISLYNYMNTAREKTGEILDFFLIGTAIACVYCILVENTELLEWARLGENEFATSGETQIYFTCCLIIATFISLYKFFSSNRRILYGVFFCFFYVCGILTGVRKCMVIPLIFLLVFIIFRNRENPIRLLAAIFISLLFIFLIVYLVMRYSSSMSTRIISLISDAFFGGSESGSDSYDTRAWLRNYAWNLFLQHPITGIGIGQFRIYSAEHGGPLLYSHNNWTELLSCTGIIGFAIYYGGIFLIAFRAYRKMKNISRETGSKEKNTNYAFIIATIISLFVMDYGQVSYYYLMYMFIYCELDVLTRDFSKMNLQNPEKNYQERKISGVVR